MNDRTLFTHLSMKFRFLFSLELLIIDTLSTSFGSFETSLSFFSSTLAVVSSSSQLRAVLDGILSGPFALLAVTVGSESRRPSRLRDRLGAGGSCWDARGEIGVLEPLRQGYCGGRPRGYLLLGLIIQLRCGLEDL